MAEQHCPHINGCELYALFQLKGALRVWQINYCEGDFQRCARYKRALCGEPIASNLLPNGKLLTIDAVTAQRQR